MQVQMLYSRFLSVRIFGIVSFKDEENYYYYTLSQLMQLNLSFQHQTGFWKLARRGCSRILAWRPSRQVAPGARSPRHLRPAPPSRGHGAASPRTRRGFSREKPRGFGGGGAGPVSAGAHGRGCARTRRGDARAHGGGMRAANSTRRAPRTRAVRGGGERLAAGCARANTPRGTRRQVGGGRREEEEVVRTMARTLPLSGLRDGVLRDGDLRDGDLRDEDLRDGERRLASVAGCAPVFRREGERNRGRGALPEIASPVELVCAGGSSGQKMASKALLQLVFPPEEKIEK